MEANYGDQQLLDSDQSGDLEQKQVTKFSMDSD